MVVNKTNKKNESNEPDKLYWQMKKSVDLSKFPKIKGYDFDKKFDFNDFLNSYVTTGIQATELGKSIGIINRVINEKVPIFLSFTSNMISSGIRDIIRYLVKNNYVNVLSTSGGGVEEDITQSWDSHRIGIFDVNGEQLLDAGLGRIGNIYTSNEHYTHLEFFLRTIFNHLEKITPKSDKSILISPSELCNLIGEFIEKDDKFNHESSYLYYAYKNKLSVFCPGIIDGAIGDILYFYNKSSNHRKIVIDTAKDHLKLIDYVLSCEKTAGLILGGGISKHYILNANIFKDGFDYAVYISTSSHFDASDSGGNQEEAISWAKIKPNAPRAKVYCDASIAFPLLVAGTFAKIKIEKNKK
jgi:deoxyhypusine synthase